MIPPTAEKPSLTLPEISPRVSVREGFRPFLTFTIASALLLVGFSKVLLDLAFFAFKTNIHSHILLVPFISGYLVWQMRPSLPRPERSRPAFPLLLSAASLLILSGFVGFRFSGASFSRADYLFFTVLSFCLLASAAVIFFLGQQFAKAVAFPLIFMFFLAPFPDRVTDALEIGSQHASAEAYSWLMDLSRATYYREGRTFVLPNLTIIVAQECSGIRSSLVLFITSLIAGHMFLRTTWKKVLLAAVVFPLGIFRNAFRIYILSMLSAHWNPNIIDSPLHHRGGPIFFALSLIPFFIFLLWLRKTEPASAKN